MPIEEEGEKEELESEEEKGEEGSSTKGLAFTAKQVATLWVSLPIVPKFWGSGPVDKVTRCGTIMSKGAWGGTHYIGRARCSSPHK